MSREVIEVIVLSAVLLLIAVSICRSEAYWRPVSYYTAESQSDRLWLEARRLKPEGMDTGEMVYYLSQLNNISTVRRGTTLTVPRLERITLWQKIKMGGE